MLNRDILDAGSKWYFIVKKSYFKQFSIGSYLALKYDAIGVNADEKKPIV